MRRELAASICLLVLSTGDARGDVIKFSTCCIRPNKVIEYRLVVGIQIMFDLLGDFIYCIIFAKGCLCLASTLLWNFLSVDQIFYHSSASDQ